jgi:hypothetical protein
MQRLPEKAIEGNWVASDMGKDRTKEKYFEN